MNIQITHANTRVYDLASAHAIICMHIQMKLTNRQRSIVFLRFLLFLSLSLLLAITFC